MTSDRSAKQAARRRKAATGEPYTLARRRIGAGEPPRSDGGTARSGFEGLVAEFRRRGWPVEVESQPLGGSWRCYLGPTSVAVGRDPLRADVASEDPDDPDGYDIATPPTIHVSAPMAIDHGGPDVVDHLLVAGTGAVDAVDIIAGLLGRARARRLQMLVDDTGCGICGDSYPAAHLLQPQRRVPPVCPACVFDGDILARTDVAWLAYQIDYLLDADLGAPAGWSAVAAALSALEGDGFHGRLQAAWRASGAIHVPDPAWDAAEQRWLWRPTGASLSGYGDPGPGASLAASVSALEMAHPHLSDDVVDALRDETGDAVDIDPAVWQVALAYAICFATQAADRPAHRPSWHVVGSWDNLPRGRLGEGWEVGGVLESVFDVLGYHSD